VGVSRPEDSQLEDSQQEDNRLGVSQQEDSQLGVSQQELIQLEERQAQEEIRLAPVQGLILELTSLSRLHAPPLTWAPSMETATF